MERQYKLTFRDKITMRLRRSPTREIGAQLARCQEAGIPMNPGVLEAHALAGGSIEDLVDGLLFVKDNNMEGDAGHVAARQLLSTNADAPTLIEQLSKLIAAGVYDASHGLDSLEGWPRSQEKTKSGYDPTRKEKGSANAWLWLVLLVVVVVGSVWATYLRFMEDAKQPPGVIENMINQQLPNRED